MNPDSTQETPAPSAHTQPPAAPSNRGAHIVYVIVPLVLYAIGIALSWSHARGDVGTSLRCVGLGLLAGFNLRRRSLLVWTFFAMLAGAELGVDAPHFAAQSRFLADIFLRLIRMIVAPLIFGGLVTGIAGHGELRGVGSVAVKALIFFEVVTTLGIFIGAIAINFSQPAAASPCPPRPCSRRCCRAHRLAGHFAQRVS